MTAPNDKPSAEAMRAAREQRYAVGVPECNVESFARALDAFAAAERESIRGWMEVNAPDALRAFDFDEERRLKRTPAGGETR